MQPEAKPTWVYFMRREKLIKIGYSNSPERRASQLGAKILVTVPGGPEQERAFHVVYRALNAGGEWFEPGPDLIGTINLLRRDQSLPPLDLTT
ncbi:hypothetical protein [Streptomyces sp. NPDC088925]|uniref:hypothetical protein n=1 Tax=Streptomyces sp. NPDC088925 TaxID=3365914 RepID=UPI0038218B93